MFGCIRVAFSLIIPAVIPLLFARRRKWNKEDEITEASVRALFIAQGGFTYRVELDFLVAPNPT